MFNDGDGNLAALAKQEEKIEKAEKNYAIAMNEAESEIGDKAREVIETIENISNKFDVDLDYFKKDFFDNL